LNRRNFVKLAVGAGLGLYVPARTYFDLGSWAWPNRWGMTFPLIRLVGADGRYLRDVRVEWSDDGRDCMITSPDIDADVARFMINVDRTYRSFPRTGFSADFVDPPSPFPTIEFE
jgi:hypothetical protein